MIWSKIGVSAYLYGPLTEVDRQVIDRCCDYIIIERLNFCPLGKRYTLYNLTKERIDTLNAVKIVNSTLKCRKIAFSGLKDKISLSNQYITVDFCENYPEVKVFPFGILKKAGSTDFMLTLGKHVWNDFTIRMRDLDAAPFNLLKNNKTILFFPNYIGYQRFGLKEPLTHELGLAYIKYMTGDTSDFLHMISSKKGVWEKEFLVRRRLDRHVQRLLINSVQSYYFNLCLSELLENRSSNINSYKRKAGVLFGSDVLQFKIKPWVSREHYECVKELVMQNEYLVEGLKRLKIETRLRPLFESADNLSIYMMSNSVVVRFKLSPGAFGTVLLRELVGDRGSVFYYCEKCIQYSDILH